MAKTDWQIRNGTLNSGDMGTAYAVVNFAVQADMKSSVHWMAPVGEKVGVIAPTVIHQALSKAIRTYGGSRLTWFMTYFTPEMIAYWETNVMGGAGNRNADVTIKTRNQKTFAFEYYNTTCIWEPERGDPRGKGYANIPVEFISMEATAS